MSTETPIACDLSAISSDEREKHEESANAVFNAIEEVRELDNGYAFRLPAETDLVEDTGAFVARERLCCPFFNFKLEVTPEHGPVWLKLTGNEQVQQYIAENVIEQWDVGSA